MLELQKNVDRKREHEVVVVSPDEIRIEYLKSKKDVARSNGRLRETLDKMIKHGLAKKVEDGYGGDIVLIVVTDPLYLADIDYYIWEDESGPEFWNEEFEEVVVVPPGRLEWW